MAQQFQVLRCCFCNIFQVQQIKKSKKWNCKMCDEKQSVLKVFGQGSGFDCRCHVQKLNLLQGEVEQAPVSMLGHTEEPGERGDENTIVRLEENLGWQEEKVGLTSRWTKYLDKGYDDDDDEEEEEEEEKVGLTSRWTKYLDKRYDEHEEETEEEEEEEETALTEKQTSHSRRNMTKNPRKRMTTSLYPTDVQGPDQKRIAGLAKNIRSFESRKDSATADTKSCGEATCKSLIAPAAEELLVHGENEDPRSKGAVLSKWEKFLLSDECEYNSGMTAPVQERLETAVKTLTAPASDEMPASFIGISPSNWCPEPKQHASILLDQVSNTEYVSMTNIPTGSRETPVLASLRFKASLLNRRPEEPASVPSASPLAVSNVKNLYSSLFSTEDDFDDYL